MGLLQTLTFPNGLNYTYDSDKVEFLSSTLRLKDRKPANSTMWATFASGVNANYAAGSATGTAVGGAAVSGGLLDLRGGTLQYVTYAAASNAAFTNTGAVRFKYTPNYTGSPSASRGLFGLLGASGLQNMIQLNHLSDGSLEFSIFNSAGSGIQNGSLGSWSPTSGTQYEFLVVIDITTGASKVFINGVQFGSTVSGTGSRAAATTLLFGTNYNNSLSPNGRYDDLIVYSVAPFTAAYTPGYTLFDTRYPADNPTVLVTGSIEVDGIEGVTETATKPSGTAVKYDMLFDNTPKYFNVTWQNGSGADYTKTNTAAEIDTNCGSLDVSSGYDFQGRIYLHSDGEETPILTSVVFDYNFFVSEPAAPDECLVYLWAKTSTGAKIPNPTRARLIVRQADYFQYGAHAIMPFEQSVAFDSDAYAEISLVETETDETGYEFLLEYFDQNNKLTQVSLGSKIVPADTGSSNIEDLDAFSG